MFRNIGYNTVSALIRTEFEASATLSTEVQIFRPISAMRLKNTKFILNHESALELEPAPPGKWF